MTSNPTQTRQRATCSATVSGKALAAGNVPLPRITAPDALRTPVSLMEGLSKLLQEVAG